LHVFELLLHPSLLLKHLYLVEPLLEQLLSQSPLLLKHISIFIGFSKEKSFYYLFKQIYLYVYINNYQIIKKKKVKKKNTFIFRSILSNSIITHL